MKLHEKVHWYVRTCWDSYRCANKEDVKRIIQEVINEHPEETNYVKLGVITKRRCIGEL